MVQCDRIKILAVAVIILLLFNSNYYIHVCRFRKNQSASAVLTVGFDGAGRVTCW